MDHEKETYKNLLDQKEKTINGLFALVTQYQNSITELEKRVATLSEANYELLNELERSKVPQQCDSYIVECFKGGA